MELTEQEIMTPEDRIKFVESELLLVLRGERTLMLCPYCHGLNKKPENPDQPEPLCCRLFAHAAIAAMSAQEIQEQLDNAARIAEHVHG